MRNQEEIVARIAARRAADLFGFEWHEYVMYLDAEHALAFMVRDAGKPMPKDAGPLGTLTPAGANPGEWSPADPAKLRQKMIDYLTFAWDKANNRRGISANRSIQHYIAWLWLVGDDAMAERVNRLYDEHYEFYGKPILVEISEHLGVDWRELDDGNWSNRDRGDGISADCALKRWSGAVDVVTRVQL